MLEAILLVGGRGTRLRPLTNNTPKPMLPVAGVPFTAHQIARARAAGVTRIILSTSYRAEVFSEYFGDGRAHGIEIVYVTEDSPLGTGGAIRHASTELRSGPDDPVLIFNGDVLSGLDIEGLVQAWRDASAQVALYLTRVPDPRAFGLVPTDDNGRVTAFLEKPTTPEEIVTDQINAGCYVFRRSVIDRIPPGRVVSVERETFPQLLAADERVIGVVDPAYWLDLGTPMAFVEGSRDIVSGRISSPALPGEPGRALVLPGALVSQDAIIAGGSAIGAGAEVQGYATVDGSVVFDGAVIGVGATVTGSVIGSGAVIGQHCRISGAVIGDGAVIGAENELLAGARVWPGIELPDCAVRFSSDQS
ncbi:MAG: sugar phosphate nucleotidyltransferase [Candidatus Nanopelagicales bacterium]